LYKFIKSYQNESNIFLWGHSLGSGISAHAAKVLSESNGNYFISVPPPNGVILESPYETISQATKDFIISPLFYNNQWLYTKGDEALELVNLKLNTSHK
jgi:alpha-beta hydrolase superfamily lysophospholipase